MKKITTIILAMALTVTMGLTAYAETGVTNNTGTTSPGNTGGTGVGVTGNGVPGNTGINNNMYRTNAADNDSDWEWIGLLGLAGLAGLLGRNRNRNPQR